MSLKEVGKKMAFNVNVQTGKGKISSTYFKTF